MKNFKTKLDNGALLVVKYPEGFSAAEGDALSQAVKACLSGGVLIVPACIEVELLGAEEAPPKAWGSK